VVIHSLFYFGMIILLPVSILSRLVNIPFPPEYCLNSFYNDSRILDIKNTSGSCRIWYFYKNFDRW